ncbi:16S rRNA (guanine(527)-N(7))-methyltransferase RsmG [Undibacterium fentianense]|uniref:Ribosomal RNA small subunit methyltransferase G n=1 Tax=Undibacterium fentianense TaxID=2828728 RepID=A0A941E3Y8_9BURK|nr:16S rRNA (guanine(527)-N(7))-methyltransferase RsmG [Undibacterium fentianense]MBR7800591.1 16S rRNA (guanine(527)-N(7))-methyltransferase RsmG [Undibacterium fentianense]
MSRFDKDALGQELRDGIGHLGLPLNEDQVEKMLAYLALLVKWNSVYNLTSIRDPHDMVKQHLLDSLSAVHAFTQAKNILDVGSGGGLPGIVLAIVFPNASVTMIDIVNKKTAFLTQVKAELKLRNVTVHTGRVELLKVEQAFDVITSRAFSELNNFINWSHHLLAEDGRFLAMKGISPTQEIERLPVGWEVESIEPLQVPGLQVERHLVHVKKAD